LRLGNYKIRLEKSFQALRNSKSQWNASPIISIIAQKE
jgi:hypothetical protein